MTNTDYLKVDSKRIVNLREDKGLTQKNLADKLHVDTSTIGHCERGRNIPIDILCQIAKYFETSTDYLLGLTNCKTPKTNYRALCDAIGIDDTAIEILEEINFVYEGQYLIPILNFLIKQEELPPDETFFEEKYRQIEDSKATDKEKKKAMRRVQSLYDRIYKRWKDKNCQPVLSGIEDYFTAKAEDTNLCLTLSGEFKKDEEITNELYIRKKIAKQLILDEVILKEIMEDLKKSKEKYKKEIEKK